MSSISNEKNPLDGAFEAIAENMFDACAVCSSVRDAQGELYDFRVEYVNHHARFEKGLTRDQLIGKCLSELLPASRTVALVAALRRTVETGEPLLWRRAEWAGDQEPYALLERTHRMFDILATKHGDKVVAVWRDVTASELAEREHKKRQRLLRLVTDTIDDAFWAATPGIEESLYVSPAYDTIWGRSRAELRSNPRAFVDGVHPEDRAQVVAHLRQLHEEHRSSSVEYRVVRPNGDLRWVHERGFWADVEPGEEPTIVGVCTDITDRVLADQARHRSETLLRKAEALAHVGAWEWDVANGEMTFSDEWLNIHGCTEHRLQRADVVTLTHPDDRARLEQLHRAVIAGTSQSFDVEYRIVRPSDGQVRSLASRARIVGGQHGDPLRMIGCDQDITERKLVEQDLRAGKEHLQSVYDVVGQAIVSVRLPERIIDGVNGRVEEIFGYSPSELVGESTQILYSSTAAFERFGEQLQRTLRAGRDRLQLEVTFRSKRGELIPCQITSTFLFERGMPSHVVSVIEDISERQRVEAETAALLAATHAVLESRNFRQAASRILDVGKWATGAKAGCIAVRDGEGCYEATIWGPSGSDGPRTVTEEAQGLLHEVTQENRVRMENEIADWARGDLILAGLGTPRNILMAPFSLEGQVQGVIALADKVSDFHEDDVRQIQALGEVAALSLQRERYVEQLLAAERLLTTIGRMARVGGWELDCVTKRVSWTAVTRELHEVPEDYEPTLETGIAFYHPDDRVRLRTVVDAAMSQGLPYDLELRVTTAKNKELWIHTRCLPVFEGGHVRKLVGAFQDITQRRAAEAQLVKADRLSSMGLLAAGVAHELNNPLSYVLSNLEGMTEDLPELLRTIRAFLSLVDGIERPSDLEALVHDAARRINTFPLDDMADRFRDALTGTRRMRDITRGLSTFARVDEDQLVPVRVAQVIDLAINMAYNEIKYRARVVKEYGRTPAVLAHEGRLCQVFVNLLTNAAHAIEEGNVDNNEIRVTTWTEGGEICVAVRDTGSGISDENLARLFEPFFTTKKIGQGSGLGLPISKNIVESYGGTLQVTSEVGQGTQFTVRLPEHSATQALVDTSTEAPPSLPRVLGRILVVDDEEGMRAAIARILRGHEIVLAASGAEAIKLLEQDADFDLVLCDVMMSDVTGMDLHTWLLATHPRLGEHLIFMTGGAFTPRARAYLGKVDNLRLEKPLDSANLRRLVNDRIQLGRRV